MKQSLLVIGNTTSRSIARLREEAGRMGVVCDSIPSHALTLEGGQVQIDDSYHIHNPLQYDVYLFRGIPQKRHTQMRDVAAHLIKHQKRVVERCFADAGLPIDKHVPVSRDGSYVVPRSHLIAKESTIERDVPLTFPLVAKKLHSSMGRGVELIHTDEALRVFLQDAHEEVLLQEYLEIEYDIRVLVVGGVALGAYMRYKRQGEPFLTTARGGKREQIELTDELAFAAQEATLLQGLEISGVDLLYSGGRLYIIEVNASPQFHVFEKATGINAAKHILSYVLS
jgi:biotin carboxylase